MPLDALGSAEGNAVKLPPWYETLPVVPLALAALTSLAFGAQAANGLLGPVLPALLASRARGRALTIIAVAAAALGAAVFLATAPLIDAPKRSAVSTTRTASPSTSQLNAVGNDSHGVTVYKSALPKPKVQKARGMSKPTGSNTLPPAWSSIVPIIPLAVAAMLFLILMGFVLGGQVGPFLSIAGFAGLPATMSALDYDEEFLDDEEQRALKNILFG